MQKTATSSSLSLNKPEKESEDTNNKPTNEKPTTATPPIDTSNKENKTNNTPDVIENKQITETTTENDKNPP